MLTRSKKEEIVNEMKDILDNSSSVVFVNFHGINVEKETRLRSGLRDKEIGYKVLRKTLLSRALEGKAKGSIPVLDGEVAVAYSQDPLSSAREVYEFQKENKGSLKILGGIFEGGFVNGEYMTEIATIPSKEVLLSKLAFLFKSPMQRLAIATSEVAKKSA